VIKRPSTRRKSDHSAAHVNLVPLLDALITIIAFLMATMSYFIITTISSPVPVSSEEEQLKKLNERPLQLSLSIRENDVRIWSPFEKVEAKTIENTPEDLPDFEAIHEHLLGIKQKFPTEKQIVIGPHPQVTYDVLIALMDAVRIIDKVDPPVFYKDPQTGLDMQTEDLFSDIVFGNLLGGT